MKDSSSRFIELTCGWCMGDPHAAVIENDDDPCQKCNGTGKVKVLRAEVLEYAQKELEMEELEMEELLDGISKPPHEHEV